MKNLSINRHEWNGYYPRYDLIPTHDVYDGLRQLLHTPGELGEFGVRMVCRRFLSVVFDIWAIDNRLKDPYVPHYPPMYEPPTPMDTYTRPTLYERILDSVVWGDPDITELFRINKVQDSDFRRVIRDMTERLEVMYPPTGYDSLLDIQMEVRDWHQKDMVIHIR